MGHHHLLGQFRSLRAGPAILVAFVAAWVLAGCAAAQHAPVAAGSLPAPALEQGENAAQHGQPAAPALPAPSALPRLTSEIGIELVYGRSFNSSLPCSLVTVDADSALFAPGGGGSLGDAAYCIYGAYVVYPTATAPEIELSWAVGEAPSAGCWLALANRDTDRWDWYFAADGANLALPQIACYFEFPTSDLVGYAYIAVLLSSGGPARLDWLRLGANMEPAGYITAEPAGAPRSLHLMLTTYDYDGSVTGVGWDFESDGVIDEWNDYDVLHTYAESGTYTITVSLLDNDGALGQAELTLPVSPWSITPQPLDTEWGCGAAVLDAAGVTHLALLRSATDDGMAPYDLLYVSNTSGPWAEELVCQVGYDSQPVLALRQGQPVILLLDTLPIEEYALRYAWREAGGWQSAVLPDGDFYPWAERLDLALDAAGTVHIAYIGDSDSSGTSLRYGTSASGFVFSDVPLPNEPTGGMALAVDGEGWPHIACGIGWFDDPCAYVHWDGAAWAAEVVPGQTYNGQVYDILVDELQRPHIVFQAPRTGPDGTHHLCCTFNDGTAWRTVDFPDIYGNARLALDAEGGVMLAVGLPNGWDFGLDGVTYFLYSDGTEWHTEIVEIPGYGGTLFGFGLDRQGRPWMAYDGQELRLATRME